ncbi:guanylyl cyclase-activating protein 1-like [Engraulis encrasicolus]|uniref:guanylyl cyclase-activating protein 1-like n=1 Tax=Engraulis encrasicolus TaxID=184585 RepID=UPI002FD2EA66
MGAHGTRLDDILAEDMHHWYNKFMKGSPSGVITLFELKAMLEMQGMTEEANSYVDQVFFTFDMDGDGYIDFVEYIAAVSLLLKGEVNQKLKWYFKLFDQDGNGKIDREEMETIFKAIQDITRKYDPPPEEIVELIYTKVDVHGEGELTLEEFISGAKEHPDIMEMLSKMMDLTHVLEIIVKGQKPREQNGLLETTGSPQERSDTGGGLWRAGRLTPVVRSHGGANRAGGKRKVT